MKSRQQGNKDGSIDPVTGAIRIDDPETVLRPRMSLGDFLATPLGRVAFPVMGNEYIGYYGTPWVRIGGREFGLGLIFAAKTEALDLVELQLRDCALDEKAGTAAHKRWLKEQLPGARALPSGELQFPWGTIEARWIPQNAECAVTACYRIPNEPYTAKDAVQIP